jgi:hypothetical protein
LVYPKKFPDTITIALKHGDKIHLIIKNNKGTGSFNLVNKANKILVKGEYSDALDTFKTYGYRINGATLYQKIKVVPYFEPVADGEWIYYSEKGLVKKREKYIKGDIP